jgi:hypothetical protein
MTQTWPWRELVILDDRSSPSFPEAPEIPGCSYYLMERTLSIGAKRNLAVSRSRGQIIAHWDDDDHSDPERIEDQVRRLLESGADVTGYSSMWFTDGRRDWLYEAGPSQPGYCLGTSLMYRRSYWRAHPFPDVLAGEDNAFIAPARAAKKIAAVPANGMMVATVHTGNTSRREFLCTTA